jgi:hypothetical protein
LSVLPDGCFELVNVLRAAVGYYELVRASVSRTAQHRRPATKPAV